MNNKKEVSVGFQEKSSSMDSIKDTSNKRNGDDNGGPLTISANILMVEPTGLESDDDPGSIKDLDEAIPDIQFYSGPMSVKKVVARPTMKQLHERRKSTILELSPTELAVKQKKSIKSEEHPGGHEEHGHKFGWIRGVLIRCILSILGTLLYLRMGWIAGRAGLGMSTVIVALSAFITTITALSMSALCTNGKIKAGGAYFMLSRSLGPEFGGTMGVVFALADAVASAMNVVGFAECVRDTLKSYGLYIVDGGINDVRIIALVTELTIFTIVMISVSWEAKIELALMVTFIISFLNFLIGTFIPPSMDQRAKGFSGYSLQNLKDNFHPDWREEGFVSILGIYFPSVTGILTGAGISGELRQPNTAIPKGTLLAILSTTLVYLSAIWITGVTAVRDASGNTEDLMNGTHFHCSAKGGGNGTCSYGLQNDYQIMSLESGWWPLILAGVFGTSISSALTLLVSAPRTTQALCKDKLYPKTEFLSKGSKRDGEPRRAYVLVLLIGLIMIAIGDLNTITPMISNFYLASFLLINYACFHGSLARSPGWRPAFKYYNMWVSLLGAVVCLVTMFVMSLPTALATWTFMFFLFIYLTIRKPDVNWGSSNQAQVYTGALHGMHTLMVTPEHVKNYRPQILCLTGNPIARCCLVDFVANITRSSCLLICGNIMLPGQERPLEGSMKEHVSHISQWFRHRKIKAFYSPAPAPNFYDGVKMLIQTAGLGKLQPNILLVGFKANWRRCPPNESVDYIKMIHEVFGANLGLCILRVSTGLDCTEMLRRYEQLEASRYYEKSSPYASHQNLDKEWGSRKNRPPPKVNMSQTTMDALELADAKKELERGQSPQLGDGLAPEPPSYTHPPSYSTATTFTAEGESKGITRRDSNLSMVSNVDFMAPIRVETSPTISDVVEEHKHEDETGVDQRPLSMIEEIGQRMRSLRKRHHLTPAQREVVFAMNQFREKMKRAVIDVYWLFDDGGLTVLIPHLLTLDKSFLEKAQLRIFTLSSNVGNVKHEQEKLKEMLNMFRIRHQEVIVLTDWHVPPRNAVRAEFENTIAPYRVSSTNDVSSMSSQPSDAHHQLAPDFCITDEEVSRLKDKTAHYLRTREIVMEHSKESQMIVITAPVPKEGKVSSCMYMAWLDLLTRDLTQYNVPVLLIRGNQESVLTFHS